MNTIAELKKHFFDNYAPILSELENMKEFSLFCYAVTDYGEVVLNEIKDDLEFTRFITQDGRYFDKYAIPPMWVDLRFAQDKVSKEFATMFQTELLCEYYDGKWEDEWAYYRFDIDTLNDLLELGENLKEFAKNCRHKYAIVGREIENAFEGTEVNVKTFFHSNEESDLCKAVFVAPTYWVDAEYAYKRIVAVLTTFMADSALVDLLAKGASHIYFNEHNKAVTLTITSNGSILRRVEFVVVEIS